MPCKGLGGPFWALMLVGMANLFFQKPLFRQFLAFLNTPTRIALGCVGVLILAPKQKAWGDFFDLWDGKPLLGFIR